MVSVWQLKMSMSFEAFSQIQKVIKSFNGKNGIKNMQAIMAHFRLFPNS